MGWASSCFDAVVKKHAGRCADKAEDPGAQDSTDMLAVTECDSCTYLGGCSA
jgi:hypothetical protein